MTVTPGFWVEIGGAFEVLPLALLITVDKPHGGDGRFRPVVSEKLSFQIEFYITPNKNVSARPLR